MSKRHIHRRLLPLTVALATCMPAILRGQTNVQASPSCNSNTLPACSSTAGGATTTATAANTGFTFQGSGSVSGTTTSPSSEAVGKGQATFNDHLSFSGGAPSQVFVDVLQVLYAGPAVAGNASTSAQSFATMNVFYGSEVGTTQAYQVSGDSPQTFSSGNVSIVGGLTRYSFMYQGSGADFQLFLFGQGLLVPIGPPAVLSGSASASASAQLVNVIGADANGTPIAGLTCSFASGAACGLGLTDVTSAPEPASMVLLATGLIAVYGAARRRGKSGAV